MLLFLVYLSNSPAHAGGGFGKAIAVGETVPHFTLDAPKSVKEQKYLGLQNTEPFSLSQLQAKLVLVEIFSTLCSTCKKSAPGMNKLFKYIQNDKTLNNDLKMLAIGQGDSPAKVGAWRKKYKVKYPLFPDQRRVVFKKFGTPGTPYTVLINNGNGKVLYAHGGQIKDVGEFLAELKGFHKKL
jgi:peroxiredoxin